MISGIILIFMGIIWFVHSFNMGGVNSAVQQTVQYLGYVCGSIFFVGGIILLNIKYIKKEIKNNVNNISVIENNNIHDIDLIKSNEKIESGVDLVITKEKQLYENASDFSSVIKCIQKETKIKFISEHNNAGTKWIYVETLDGNKGYCIKDNIKYI